MWRGNPEGIYWAPCGYVLVDYDTGDMYRKTTPEHLGTGWVVTLDAGLASGASGVSLTYETFADLRQEIGLVDKAFAWLSGGYALHDNNGGVFKYDASSFAPDDDYNTIMPNIKSPITPGRWERDFP